MNVFQEPEGATELTPDDINGLKHDVETREALNELEFTNITQAQHWLNGRPATTAEDIFDINFVLKLHQFMFGDVWGWAGQFRITELNIGCAPHQITTELKNLLDDIKTWMEFDNFESLELCARIQHGLVKIHPFPNGNGRFSRLFTDYVRVVLLDLPPMNWANGDLDKQSEERSEYISSLREADKGNFEPFVQYLKERGN